MFKRLAFSLGVAAASAGVVVLLAGAWKWPSAGLKVFVKHWAGRAPAGTVDGKARGALRQAVTWVSATLGAHDAAAGGTPATSGGVIPLETVPIDELSEWELDLLTTPDS